MLALPSMLLTLHVVFRHIMQASSMGPLDGPLSVQSNNKDPEPSAG